MPKRVAAAISRPASWDAIQSVAAQVLLDTSAFILLIYGGQDWEKLRKKDFFRDIVSTYRCCVSPITVGELKTDKWYASLGEKRAQKYIEELRSYELVMMNYATGDHYSKMNWPKQVPGPNDLWQVTLASLHGLYLATADNTIYDRCNHLATIWTPDRLRQP